MNNKNWSTLEKGSQLHLLIPNIVNNKCEYTYQKSQIINIHHYDWCVNIRFKYTDQNGKRKRVEFCVNKYKFNNDVLSVCKETSYARQNNPKWGDLLITYLDIKTLFNQFKICLGNEINTIENKINDLNDYKNWLTNKGTIIKHKTT